MFACRLIVMCTLITGYVQAQNVGIGQTAPVSRLDVNGGLTVGATYSGTNAAPANGAIIEGDVGIGTATPGARLDVEGTFKLGTDGDVNNGLYTLIWNWGANTINTAGTTFRLTGTSSILNIPSTASVFVSFLGVVGGGNQGIGPDIYVGHAWMENDAVGFWVHWDGAFGSYAIPQVEAHYTFVW